MTSIKKVDYCPEWFDLVDYEGLEHLTPRWWNSIIRTKSLAYNEIIEHGENREGIDIGFELSYLMGTNRIIELVGKGGSPEIDEELSVKEADFMNLYFLYERSYLNNSEQRDFLRTFNDELDAYLSDTGRQQYSDSQPSLSVSFGGKLELSQTREEEFLIALDLTCSDDSIIEDFKVTLTNIRQKLKFLEKERKRLSLAQVKSIVKYKVVPYIDLMIWGLITNKPLTDQQIADILYPDGEYSIDTIRKTVKPKARELLSRPYTRFV